MITTDIKKAIIALNNNNVVAIPTETVYGLAGNAFNEIAVKKIFELKKRPFYNPLIVHIKSIEYLDEITVDIPDLAKKLATRFWPGPLTLILKKHPRISNLVTANKDTVAVRIPNHPLALNLLNQLNYPLAAPSANPFGSISPTSAHHVHHYFKDNLEVILDGGDCEKGLESTIVGFEENQAILYRHGAIPMEEIKKCIGAIAVHTNENKTPNAPGMLSSHYAPKTATYLTNNVSNAINLFKDKKLGLLLFNKKINNTSFIQEVLSFDNDFNEAAKNLYAALHRLDHSNLEIIIAEKLPDEGLGKAINDRLERAKTANI